MADFDNLPGIYVDLTDGNLQIVEANPAPVVTVLGTAEKGATGVLYPVVRPADAVNNFGSGGTLIRGMYEARFGGSQNTVLMRIGASAAKVLYVGDSTSLAGITVESVDKDNTAGDDLYIWWDDSENHLKVFDAEATLVFEMQNDVILTDTGRVYATGTRATGGGPDIPDDLVTGGTLMSSCPGVDDSLRFDAGDDGTTPSYMRLYEDLDKAYRSLEAFDSDFVVPMGAYMDAPNVIDDATVLGSNTYDPSTPGSVTTVDLEHSGVIETSLVVQVDPAGSGVYDLPTMEWYLSPGTGTGGVDRVIFHTALGASDEVRFVYEYLIRDSLLFYRSWEEDGELMHEWSTTRWRGAWDGSNYVTYEYYEANFAWQLANYCYNLTKNDNDCVGMIGVMPFRSTALKDIADWAGFLPTYDESTGLVTVNGGGLAGNKWMAGMLVTAFEYTELSAVENFGPAVSAQDDYDLAAVRDVVPGSVVVFIDGTQNYDWSLSPGTGGGGEDQIIFSTEVTAAFSGGEVLTTWYIYDDGGAAAQFGPGFWATAEETPDGTAVSPATDIGRHLSMVGSWPILFTPVDTTGFGYVATGAPAYAGFVSQLAPQSAPTNKVVPDIQMPFRMSKTRLDDLVSVHYTMFAARERGTIVVDAPTAATSSSDYQRLTTIRIVNECVQRVRRTLEPFIGEGLSTPQMEAMQTSTDRVLTDAIKDGLLQRFEASVTATAIERVQGKANVELLLVPAFELRQIYVTISLSAV